MKKIIKILLSFTILFCLISCSNDENIENKELITISASEAQASMLEGIVSSFNQKYHDQYEAKLEIESSEEIKNYKFKHHAINSDIIAFDSFNTANQFNEDYLINLTLDDAVEKYQISIINYIKDNNDKLFCFPSLGRFYANCYNLDIMNKYSFNVPKTLDEKLILAKRSELKVNAKELTKTSATIGGDDSILFALMQIAFPEFLGTTTGNYFLKEFKKENVNMSDSKYQEYFKDIFRKFHQLYYASYYSLDDQARTKQDGINDFVEEKTILLQTSLDFQYDNIKSKLKNTAIYPFTGVGEGQEWIASKPLFYLAVNKNIESKNYPCAKAFFQYFNSKEGQDLMSNSNQQSSKCYISYVKDIYLELGDDYKNILKSVLDGRIFIVDNFFQIFGSNINALVSYLKNEITVDELIKIFDERSYLKSTNESMLNVLGEFDYDDSFGYRETKISNYFSDIIRKFADTDCVLLNYDAIKANIYSDGFYRSELDVVLSSKRLVYKKTSIKQLKSIMNAYIQENKLPCISGIRITLEQNEIKIFDKTNKLLNDNDTIITLIDEDILLKNNLDYESDNQIDLRETIAKILSNQTTIIAPNFDNRYGNIVLR